MAKGGRPAATHARAIENMNETQLAREISSAQKKIDSAQNKINQITGKASAQDAAMREAFPLGAGGLSSSQAQKYAGRLSENAAKQGRELTKAVNARDSAQKRLDTLKNAQKRVKGTGKTLKEVGKAESNAPKSTMKWKTTQKEQRIGSSLQPRVMQSGDFQIVGKGFMRVYKNGAEIGRATSLSAAKAIAERNK